MFHVVVASDLYDAHPIFWSQSIEAIDKYLSRLTREEAEKSVVGELYFVELWSLTNNGHCDSMVVCDASESKWCCERKPGKKKRIRKNEQKDLF